MKGLYLHFFSLPNYSGISKKILHQIKAFEENGASMELCTIEIENDGTQKRVCNGAVIDNFGKGLFAKFGKWVYFKNLTRHILSNGFTFVYVRSFYNANPLLIRFFNRLKREGVKVLLEYPTYPYDQECKSEHIRYQPIFLLNRLSRPFLKWSVDRIVTFSHLPQIEGIPTINISNAIDFDSIKLSSPLPFDGTKFIMIAVAEIHFWHGYDRIIRGLENYYKGGPRATEVRFNIVGAGSQPDYEQLVALTRELKLEEYVHFYGNRVGEELDSLFDNSHFAIASLGRHRTGITHLKTLKNREYAARGFAFTYSELDSDFDTMSYVLKQSPDESPIEILALIEFYKDLTMSPSQIRGSIEESLSWVVQMQKVLSAITLLR